MKINTLPKMNVWGINFTPFSIKEFIDIIEENIRSKQQLIQQTGVNAYTVVSVQKDVDLRNAINKSQLVNIDGMSVAWALKFLGYKNISKVSCPDIFDRLIELSAEKGFRPFFLGATPEIIEKMILKLQNKYPSLQIAGFHHGYFDEPDSEGVAKLIKESNADLLLLGISSPKKELFSKRYIEFMQVPYTFGVGGVFDIIAGVTKRAPRWMQDMGMEWIYRLIQEPGRMWKRYLIGNTKFIWYVGREKWRRTIE